MKNAAKAKVEKEFKNARKENLALAARILDGLKNDNPKSNEINWATVGSENHVKEMLQRLSDSLFCEGEFDPNN